MKLIQKLKNYLTKEKKKDKLMNMINEIVDKSYYDEESNTLVINSPTNLIINTAGTQLNIARSGNIIHLADIIHLNPPVTNKTKINIQKLDKSYDDIMRPFQKLVGD